MAEHSKTASLRFKLKWLCQLSTTASNMLMREVMPAKNTDRKKNTANSWPMGICWNTAGSVRNIKEGPRATSSP